MTLEDTSRFVLSEDDEITVRMTGRQWLAMPIGQDRRLPAQKLETLMTEEEFLRFTDLTSS